MKKLLLFLCLFFFLTFSLKVSAEEYNCAAGIHKFDTVITDATETEPGSITYTCGLCGYTYAESIAPYGHDWGEWVTDQEPDCIHEGHTYRVCRNNPEHVEEETLPANGIHDFTMTEKEATAAETGSRTYICSVCGYRYMEEIPALTGAADAAETAAPAVESAADDDTVREEPAEKNDSVNAADYILCSVEALQVLILSLFLRSKLAVIKWDRELWKRNSGSKKHSGGDTL